MERGVKAGGRAEGPCAEGDGPAGEDPAGDKAALRALFGEYAQAAGAGEAERWMALWDEEGVQMPPNEPEHAGKAAILEANRGLLEKYDCACEMDCREIVVSGGYAFASGAFRLSYEPKGGGEASGLDGKFLTVLRRRADGAWRIYRDCFNSNLPLR